MRVFNLDQLKHVFRSYVIILCCKRGGKYGFHRKTRLFAFFIIHLSGGAKTGSKVCTTEYSIIYNSSRKYMFKMVIKWLLERYGKEEAVRIWRKTRKTYNSWLFDLNRNGNMWLIDRIFQKVGERDRKDAKKYPAGFLNVNEPYDREHHAARYHFTQCPNAEFAKKHDLLHVLPLLCNCDFFGIEELHGKLIRCGTCGNSKMCDYLVVGDKNPIVAEYETVTDEGGFLVSRKKSI